MGANQGIRSVSVDSDKILALWTTRHSSTHRKLSLNIMREVCSYLGEAYLPGICKDSLRIYNLRGGTVAHAYLSLSFTAGTMHCAIDDQNVLCIGGRPSYTAEVYSLNIFDYGLTARQAMKSRRGFPGVIKNRTSVYVFGGFDGSEFLNACEKYSLVTMSWISLPSMQQSRSSFSPCLYEGEIYLPEVRHTHRVLETFNVSTEEFRTLAIQLPVGNCNSVAFIMDGELFIISEDYQVNRWRIKSEESKFRGAKVKDYGGYPRSSSPPVQIGRRVYWAHYGNGDLNVFDIDASTIAIK